MKTNYFFIVLPIVLLVSCTEKSSSTNTDTKTSKQFSTTQNSSALTAKPTEHTEAYKRAMNICDEFERDIDREMSIDALPWLCDQYSALFRQLSQKVSNGEISPATDEESNEATIRFNSIKSKAMSKRTELIQRMAGSNY